MKVRGKPRIEHLGIATVVLLAAPALQPAAAQSGEEQIEEIVVTAGQFRDDATSDVTGFDLAVAETPQSVTILSREVMDVTLSTSAISAADYIAGLNVVRPAGGIDTDFRARGFIMSQSNGFRQNGFPLQHNFYPDTVALERIEFIKGVNSVRYGENQPGGFVNYVFKQPAEEQILRAKFIGGSYSFLRAELDAGGPLDSSGRIRGRFISAHERDKTYVDHVDSDTTVIAPSLAIDFGDRWTQKVYGYFQEFNTIPEAGVSLDNDGNFPDIDESLFTGQPWNRVENQSATLQSITTFQANDSFSTDVALHYTENESYRHYARPRNGIFTQPTLVIRPSDAVEPVVFVDEAGREYIEVAAGTATGYDIRTPANAKSRNYGVTLRSTLEFDAFDQSHVVTGALEWEESKGGTGFFNSGSRASAKTFNIMEPDYSIPFNQTVIVPSNTGEYQNVAASVMGLFRPFERLSILAGARIDDSTDKSISPDGTVARELPTDETTFSLGMTYSLTDDVNLYATTGESFSPNPGVCDVAGNLLPPTSGEIFEVGAKGEFFSGNVLATVAVFDLTREDVAQEDLILDPEREFGCSNAGAWRTSGEERSEGVEIEVVGNITDNLRLIASYSHIDSDIVEDNNPDVIGVGTPNVAENSARFFATYSFDNDLMIGAGAIYRDERPIAISPNVRFFNGFQRDPNDPTIPLIVNGVPVATFVEHAAPLLPSDLVVNLMASYPLSERVRVGINVENLFDEEGWESGFSAGTTGLKPLRPRRIFAYIEMGL